MTLDGDLADIFGGAGASALVHDPGNYGHIHAPSLDHAVAAAILRNGHLANATLAAPDLLERHITGGKLRGLLDLRDNTLPDIALQVGELAEAGVEFSIGAIVFFALHEVRERRELELALRHRNGRRNPSQRGAGWIQEGRATQRIDERARVTGS